MGTLTRHFPNHEWIDEMQDFANLLLPAFVYNLSTAQLIKASSTSEQRVIGVVRFFFIFFFPRRFRSAGARKGPVVLFPARLLQMLAAFGF